MFRKVLDMSHCATQEDKYVLLYEVFREDFIRNSTYLADSIYINPSFQGQEKGKEKIFWHIVTRKNEKSKKREFDQKRAERIEWVKRIITHHDHTDIKCFYFYENSKKIRLYMWAHAYDFLVILQKLGATESYLVTSFYIDRPGKKETMQRKYDDYIAKKDVRLNGCEWF